MKRAATLLLILVLLGFGTLAGAENRYTLPSGEVDLVDFARTISKITGFSILHGKDFSGKANLVISNAVTAKEAFEIFLSVLADAGYSTVEKGRVIKIVPRGSEVDPKLVFLKGEPIGPSDQRITVFIELAHISSEETAAALQSMTSPEGKLLASPAGNRLIVVDHAANVERIRKAVVSLDRAGNRLKIESIPLERASAAEVTEILRRIFPMVGQSRGTVFGRHFVALADLRTNSVVVQAPDDEIVLTRKLLAKIDVPEPSEIKVEMLRSADPDQLVKLFDSLK